MIDKLRVGDVFLYKDYGVSDFWVCLSEERSNGTRTEYLIMNYEGVTDWFALRDFWGRIRLI